VAVTAAREGRRVIAVDANLRRPGVAVRLGLPESPGLRDVLLGAVTLERFFQPTEQPNLFALTAGTPAGHAWPSFAPDTVRSLLAQLRRRFDLVLVDGPPWDAKPDATILGTACDAVYLVVPAAQAHTPAVDGLLRTIPEQGACLAGYILAGA
jgi:Mrp family chromosome partitioning ATPase